MTFRAARVQLITSLVFSMFVLAERLCPGLGALMVTVPALSVAVNPTKSSPVGVYEVLSKLTLSGASKQLITSLAISMFVPGVKGVGATIVNVVFS